MKYVCDICGWVYDEDEGYPEGGIAPAPSGKTCPRISSARSATSARISSPKRMNKKSMSRANTRDHFLCSGAFPGTSGPVFRLKNRAAPHNCVCALRRSCSANSAVLP